ncbi:MAG: hypothetical protein HZB77_14340, partial [Chloroflexi bacterium]|nr:hypothetical protein [Chloroflexota bacterium]
TIMIHKADGTSVVKQVKPEKAVKLAPDVREYFPNSQSVNRALRGLIPPNGKSPSLNRAGENLW